MTMFGKAIGNGYAINAIIGKIYERGLIKHLLVVLFGPRQLDLWCALQTLDEIKKN